MATTRPKPAARVASSPCIASSVDAATVDAGRAPDGEADDADASDDDDDAEGGADAPPPGTEGRPGPSKTTGGGDVDGVSVRKSEGATARTSSGSAVSASIRSVASSSATRPS